ncbi:MAG: hypothetical protein A2860_01655 [Candidatus Levybacteria bacterium RIFCSPHIGHO2_01_FULL_37_33]|nr:MAG: hypothetical protein A2860_01655 [Candidatus Levybacteria bacterium RIFCSPHIGHO2_01_FULL_37_33]
MKKKPTVILEDSEKIRNIVIQVNLEANSTTVFSSFSAWENLALILEGLGVTAQKCIKEGMSRRKVYEQVKKYMIEVLSSYETK